MKKRFLFASLLSFFTIALIAVSCTSDPYEYCEIEEFCNNQEVEACCTDDNGDISCVWKYNGKEYTDIKELNEDLGCSASAIVLKSEEASAEQDDVLFRLQALMDRAHAGLRANHELR
jgi:hypothetical protein